MAAEQMSHTRGAHQRAAPRGQGTPAQEEGSAAFVDDVLDAAGAALPSSERTVMITFNVHRALDKKIAALEDLIKRTDAALIALQEIGDTNEELSHLAALCRRIKYVPFTTRRRVNSSHGGTAVLVRADLQGALASWPAAEAWHAECEVTAVRILPTDGSASFVFASMYVHGASTDTAGFRRVLNTCPPDFILAGDLNAQMAGSTKNEIAHHFAARGNALCDFIDATGAMYPTPCGPTRPRRELVAGKWVHLDSGTVNDHFVIGHDVLGCILHADMESQTLPGAWPSDHLPLIWSAVIGGLGKRDQSRADWCAHVRWHAATAADRQRYNERVRELLKRAATQRDFTMATLESALHRAAVATLPCSRPRHSKDGLFWTQRAKERIAAVANRRGTAAAGAISREHARLRRERLLESFQLTDDPAVCWKLIRAFYGFGQSSSLEVPLTAPGPPGADGKPTVTTATSPQQRADMLAESYAAVHKAPAGDDVDARMREEIKKLEERAAQAQWRQVSLTELRAAIAELNSNRCADFVSIKAEHVKSLDDASVAAIRPFIDKHLRLANVPKHWRSALVTPIPKRKRDLSLCKSWRPVSITALLCRLCEIIVQHRVLHIIEQGTPDAVGCQRRGLSQFGFRRGLDTTTALTALSMFVRDGWAHKKQRFQPWVPAEDGDDAVAHGAQARLARDYADAAPVSRNHATLLVCVDASDAFCRADTPARDREARRDGRRARGALDRAAAEQPQALGQGHRAHSLPSART